MEQTPLILPPDEYNRKLLENVHPAQWKNPEPASMYNLVVIGAGTAGLVTAAGAAGLGAKVALIEQHLMGGDCLNVGCVPSKGLIRASRAAFDIKQAGLFGIHAGPDVSIDFGKAMERMRGIRSGISSHDSAERFRGLGIDVFFGSAKFTGRDSIEVDGKRLRFKKAAVCTGARAATPKIPGIEEAGFLTNESVFELTELPKRLAVIGGGPIGCEMAQAFSRMGSRVTLLQQSGQLLPRDDADAAEVVRKALVRDGVDVRLGVTVVKAEKSADGKAVHFDDKGKTQVLAVDAILAAAGRAPNVEGLDLEKAGIAYEPSGVLVDDRLRTTNPRVYAAGDVCSAFQFTHAADAYARIVIANALFKARQRASSLVIPWCTYTDPEVAHVGMNENEARKKGLGVTAFTVPLADVDRALLENETEGYGRVLLKQGSDAILGATIVARHAGEMINEITLAMTAGLGLSSIGKTIHPYPTQAEAVRKLADAYNRTRLTPRVKKLFTSWLAWQRS